jgi:phage gpG-like protein
MTLAEFRNLLLQQGKKIEELTRRRMPVIVGAMAVSHFKAGFRQGGFTNNGLQAWQPAKRLAGKKKGAANRYKTLTSGRNHLMSSISYIPGDASVLVKNDVPYASIHNEGGQVNTHPTVTPKMRKFAWAKYYEALNIPKGSKVPKNIPEDAARWRALALTKKTKLNISYMMPKRQFIGDSKELNDKIAAKFESEIEKIINN